MKEYIRTTHNFNNKTREWVYRGNFGEEKYELWNSNEVFRKTHFKNRSPYYSFGVHALENWQWKSIDWVVDETIDSYLKDAAGDSDKFKKFMKSNPNYRKIVERDVLEELEYLISVDMVRVRESR